VAYHGRASSIVVSGTPFRRPKGQINASDNTLPTFAATKRLDIELEMATIIGRSNPLGEAISVAEAEEYVFGFLLFNDWSARDIQRWEYVPLGPFLGKNFCSSISPWVVTLAALEDFRTSAKPQSPAVLPYLADAKRQNFDVKLEVFLETNTGETIQLCASNFKHVYWTVAQQIAHHTVNGCNLQIGDVLASGTISGPTPDSFGSLLEITWGGQRPIQLPGGQTRTFLEDGDTIVIQGYAENRQKRISFGEIRTTILPSLP
jgi:fumarylacetoacetase